MASSVTCPECDARVKLRTAPVDGARLKCPECSTKFTFSDASDEETSAASKKSAITASKKSGMSADSPARRRRDPDEPDEEEERKPRKKKKAKAGSKMGLFIGLGVGAGALLVLGVVAVGVVIYVMREKPAVQQQAKGDPAKNKDGKVNDPGQVVLPVPQPPKVINPAELYGDQGGEQVAAADPGLPSTLMRARRDDTFFKLSNPREGDIKTSDGKGKTMVRQALLIDYVVVRRGKFDGGMLVIHTDDGDRAEIALNDLAGRDQGTIELVGVTNFGFGKGKQVNTKTQFPKNVEFYVTRGDNRYKPPAKFMVSNSMVMGDMKLTTRARDWTPDEINNYGKAPPAYLSPNQHPTLGDDLPPAKGWAWTNRYVEPEGRLLGLEYHIGAWANQKRIGSLVPIFSQDQPTSKTARELARPGYAVAGAEVNVDKDGYVFGVRLLYRRLKADNTLDAADAYSSEWIGAAPAGAPRVLANDGRRVMGMCYQSGLIIDRFALVVAK